MAGEATRAAFGHINDALSQMTREQVMTAATALQAGWMTDAEREALRDLAAGFERLSTADAPEDQA